MKNFLLLSVVLVFSIICFEAALLSVGFTPRIEQVNEYFIPNVDTTWSIADDELGWINKPGVSLAIGEDSTPMTFWNFSRRASREDPAIPKGNQTPVMIVGGSITQSYGVRDENSFPYLLSQRYPNLWIENFGTGGYGTVQTSLLAQRAYEGFYPEDRKPQFVLMAISGSHILRNVSHHSWVLSITNAQGLYVAPPHYRNDRGVLIFHPFQIINNWPLEFRSAGLALAHNVWLRRFRYNTADQGVIVTREIVRRFVEFSRQRNMKFGILVTADDSQTTGLVLSDQMFPYVDCSGPDRADPKAYLLPGNGHPNSKLHAHFAECIGNWLDSVVIPTLKETQS